MGRKHIVITGTGRSGTTFLIELMTHLGLDTGFSVKELEANKEKVARAGMEHDIREKGAPHVVKSPMFCDYADQVLGRDDISIEHVFVPIRELHAAAESRRYVVKRAVAKWPLYKRLVHAIAPREVIGGLWHTHSSKGGVQEEILLRQIYKLVLALSNTLIPITFMRYPRIVKECPYLYDKLRAVLGETSYDSFRDVFNRTVRPDLIHSFNRRDN